MKFLDVINNPIFENNDVLPNSQSLFQKLSWMGITKKEFNGLDLSIKQDLERVVDNGFNIKITQNKLNILVIKVALHQNAFALDYISKPKKAVIDIAQNEFETNKEKYVKILLTRFKEQKYLTVLNYIKTLKKCKITWPEITTIENSTRHESKKFKKSGLIRDVRGLLENQPLNEATVTQGENGGTINTYDNGRVIYKNSAGEIHRDDDQPAVIDPVHNTKEWYKNDKAHRDFGPSVVYDHGGTSWHKHGLRHRIDGPAVDWPHTKKWFSGGVDITDIMKYYMNHYLIIWPFEPNKSVVKELDADKDKIIPALLKRIKFYNSSTAVLPIVNMFKKVGVTWPELDAIQKSGEDSLQHLTEAKKESNEIRVKAVKNDLALGRVRTAFKDIQFFKEHKLITQDEIDQVLLKYKSRIMKYLLGLMSNTDFLTVQKQLYFLRLFGQNWEELKIIEKSTNYEVNRKITKLTESTITDQYSQNPTMQRWLRRVLKDLSSYSRPYTLMDCLDSLLNVDLAGNHIAIKMLSDPVVQGYILKWIGKIIANPKNPIEIIVHTIDQMTSLGVRWTMPSNNVFEKNKEKFIRYFLESIAESSSDNFVHIIKEVHALQTQGINWPEFDIILKSLTAGKQVTEDRNEDSIELHNDHIILLIKNELINGRVNKALSDTVTYRHDGLDQNRINKVLLDCKPYIMKYLLELMKNGDMWTISRRMKLLRALGQDWDEFKILARSIDHEEDRKRSSRLFEAIDTTELDRVISKLDIGRIALGLEILDRYTKVGDISHEEAGQILLKYKHQILKYILTVVTHPTNNPWLPIKLINRIKSQGQNWAEFEVIEKSIEHDNKKLDLSETRFASAHSDSVVRKVKSFFDNNKYSQGLESLYFAASDSQISQDTIDQVLNDYKSDLIVKLLKLIAIRTKGNDTYWMVIGMINRLHSLGQNWKELTVMKQSIEHEHAKSSDLLESNASALVHVENQFKKKKYSLGLDLLKAYVKSPNYNISQTEIDQLLTKYKTELMKTILRNVVRPIDSGEDTYWHVGALVNNLKTLGQDWSELAIVQRSIDHEQDKLKLAESRIDQVTEKIKSLFDNQKVRKAIYQLTIEATAYDLPLEYIKQLLTEYKSVIIKYLLQSLANSKSEYDTVVVSDIMQDLQFLGCDWSELKIIKTSINADNKTKLKEAMNPAQWKIHQEQELIKRVSHDPFSILNMTRPSEAVKMAAVKSNGLVVRELEDPSEELLAVALDQIKNNKDLIIKFLLTAFKNDPNVRFVLDDITGDLKFLKDHGFDWPELKIIARSVLTQTQEMIKKRRKIEETDNSLWNIPTNTLRRNGSIPIRYFELDDIYEGVRLTWKELRYNEITNHTAEYILEEYKTSIIKYLLSLFVGNANWEYGWCNQTLSRLETMKVDWPELKTIRKSLDTILPTLKENTSSFRTTPTTQAAKELEPDLSNLHSILAMLMFCKENDSTSQEAVDRFLLDRKHAIIKYLLTKTWNAFKNGYGSTANVQRIIFILHELNQQWPELDSITRSIEHEIQRRL